MKYRLILAIAMFCWSSAVVQAAAMRYALTLEVTRIDHHPNLSCNGSGDGSYRPSTDPTISFGCVAVGDLMVGGFDSLVFGPEQSGVFRREELRRFWQPFGIALFSTDSDNLSLVSLNNGLGFAPSLALHVAQGTVVGVSGTAHGRGDIAFIDYYYSAQQGGTFRARADGLVVRGNVSVMQQGVVSSPSDPTDPVDDDDATIPVPSAWILLAGGLLGLGRYRKRTFARG